MPQERILVVDDEATVRGVLTSLLTHSGYTTVMAGGADEALTRLREDSAYDLVLSDIMMPGTDGLGLLDVVRREHPELPVVMVSAVHDIHVATNAFRRGAA